MTLQESLNRARNGDLTIDTPKAASDLYEILLERWDLQPQDGVIQIRRTDHGAIEFRVKVVIFRFTYQPGQERAMFYRHMESDRWYNAQFDDKNPDPVKHIVNLVTRYAHENLPKPV